MRNYFCYIHTVGSTTPQMRIVPGTDHGLSNAVAAAVLEWPARTMVEVYNDLDEYLFRLIGVSSARVLGGPWLGSPRPAC